MELRGDTEEVCDNLQALLFPFEVLPEMWEVHLPFDLNPPKGWQVAPEGRPWRQLHEVHQGVADLKQKKLSFSKYIVESVGFLFF